MSLSVDVPEPPALNEIDPNEYDDAEVAGGDYRREDIEELLEQGAWEEAFEIWAEDTDVDEREWEMVQDLGLLEEFDFFWDDFADRVGYHAPGIPEDWKVREVHPDLESWGQVSSINAGLTELGQIVCEILKDHYIDWEADYDAPEDLPDFD